MRRFIPTPPPSWQLWLIFAVKLLMWGGVWLWAYAAWGIEHQMSAWELVLLVGLFWPEVEQFMAWYTYRKRRGNRRKR